MSRSSGSAETSRATRSTRARRATVAKGPATGRSDSATTAKSKTFQPSRKKPSRRGPGEEPDRDLDDEDGLNGEIEGVDERPVALPHAAEVSRPMSAAFARMTTRIVVWKRRFAATRRHREIMALW